MGKRKLSSLNIHTRLLLRLSLFQALAQAGVRLPGMSGGNSGCVLLVSNLNETETDPDHLFILFGVYGDVQV